MFYPQETIQEVLALNDIVDVVAGHVTLKQQSGSHFGLCPFHNEKTASFSVNRDRQIFYCFGCGAGGNAITFIMRIENSNFTEAVQVLADKVNFQLPQTSTTAHRKQAAAREVITQLNKRAARFYFDYLHSNHTDALRAREYLASRGIHPKLVRRFGLGLSPPYWDGLLTHLIGTTTHEDLLSAGLILKGNKDANHYYDRFRKRLMFPIIDQRNKVIGFGGRIMEKDKNSPKYINSPETDLFHKGKQLYGLNLARKTRSKEILITEGYMDVLALHQGGFPNSVGVLGTALTDFHVRLLRNANCETVILILDSDEAGVRATLRAIPLLSNQLKVRVLQLPNAKDPDEFLQKYGVKRLEKLITNAKHHVAFQVGLLYNQHDLRTTDGRIAFTQEAAKILSSLPSAIEADAYISETAKASNISPAAIYAEIKKQQNNGNTNSVDVATATKNLKAKPSTLKAERGLYEAKKGLLYLALTNPLIALALKKSNFLEPQELGDEIYSQLLLLAFKNASSNTELSPADIIAYFDSTQAQERVAEIFITPASPIFTENAGNMANVADTEKALNHMVLQIKRAWVDKQIVLETKNDNIDAVNELYLSKKSMTFLNITIQDG